MEWITHDEDLWFEFEGDDPDQLTAGRFYRGVVDGFADFGVFVTLGDGVTGLLHRSEIDSRLENLDWDAGDDVFVQVTAVRDNGDVDLGWSIRQSPEEFRGHAVDDPYSDEDVEDTLEPTGQSSSSTTEKAAVTKPSDGGSGSESGQDDASRAGGASDRDSDGGAATESGSTDAADVEDSGSIDEPEPTSTNGGTVGASAPGGETTVETMEPTPITVEAVEDNAGEIVSIQGIVEDLHQTGGPTIFEVHDETGLIECAAFESAGVRAYPEVEVGDAVRIVGVVEEHYGDPQIETDELEILKGEDAASVRERLDAAAEEAASAPADPLLYDVPATAERDDHIRAAATDLRRAVFEGRQVVVRHPATPDATAGAVAIERALLSLIEEEHAIDDAPYRFLDRRPLRDPLYAFDATIDDVTDLLSDARRHGDKPPVFVTVGTGGSVASGDALELLSIYDAATVVIDAADGDEEIAEWANTLLTGSESGLANVDLAASVAALVAPDVRADLQHLPAVGQRDPTEAAVELAEGAGEDVDLAARRRSALALAAYHNARDDKRELVADVLFQADGDLATRLADQYDDHLGDALETATANAFEVPTAGPTVSVLDAVEFTSKYDFPPTELLVTELHRSLETPVTVVVEEDALYVESDEPVDRRAVAEDAAGRHPDGAVEAMGGADGHIRFLQGERDAVIDVVIEAIGESLQ